MHSFGKSQDILVQFPWYALEHSLDVVDRTAEYQNKKSLQSRLKVENMAIL